MDRWESLAERLIREAAERGAFDDLPGTGKPIEGLDRPFSAERWARDWIRREGGDTGALLSPLPILRRERAALLASPTEMPSEASVRELVSDFNHRLLSEYRRPANGPLVPVGVIDAEQAAEDWRSRRPALHRPDELVAAAAPIRRRWWRRSIGRRG